MAPEPRALRPLRVEVELEIEDGLDAAWDEPPMRQLVSGIVQRELAGASGRHVVALHLVSDDTIAALNQEHRGKDSPTDVLSFPLHDPEGMRFVLPPEQAIHLGDVVVSYPRALAQAEEYGHPPERELAYLVAHGVLHLLGHDHEDDDERRRMRAREEEALGALGLTRE